MSEQTIRLQERFSFIKNLILETGTLVLKGFGNCQYSKKENPHGYDIVTEFDTRAEEMIRRSIQETYGEPVIGEEYGVLGDQKKARERVWIVDPIDGTRNYRHGIPLYGVSIGYCEEGEPVVGAVFLPTTGQLFIAGKGLGAKFINTLCGEEKRIVVDKERQTDKFSTRNSCIEFLRKTDLIFRTDSAENFVKFLLQIFKGTVSGERKPHILDKPPENFYEVQFGRIRRNIIDIIGNKQSLAGSVFSGSWF